MSNKEEQPFLNITQNSPEASSQFDLVLQFNNPYEFPDHFYTPSFDPPSIPLKQAKHLYTQVFKLDTLSPDCKPDLSSRLEDSLKSLNTLSQLKSMNTLTLYQLIFNDMIMLLQDTLHLRLNLFYSRDYKFIFCKLKASEYNLMVHADMLSYPLQYKRSMKEYHDYMFFSPHVPFRVLTLQGSGRSDNMYMYERYNRYDEEDTSGSLFQSKDRIRLIRDMIESAIDIGEAKRCKILVDYFLLHIDQTNDMLKSEWGSFGKMLKTQRMEMIREYYGENIALHYSWIEYLVRWVVILGILGISVFMLRFILDDIDGNDEEVTGLEVYVLIISILFPMVNVLILIFWKRNMNAFKHTWGIDINQSEGLSQRSNFIGKYIQDPITGKYLKTDFSIPSNTLKHLMVFFINLCFMCISVAATISLKFYAAYLDKDGWSNYAVGILNSLQIKLFNIVNFIQIFHYVATSLNDWLNYESQSDYESALILRLFAFQFLNSYGYLAYVAFLKGRVEGCEGNDCYEELTIHLTYLFIGYILLNLIELSIP
jgi:hypothetical protein